MGAEGQAADLGPAGAAVLQRLSDVAGVLPGGPDEDGGSGAGDGGAEGAQLFGRVDQVHRARVKPAATLLVDAIGEAGSDQIEVGLLQAEDEARGGGDVGDGVGKRQLGGDGLASALGGDLLSQIGRASCRERV